MRAATLEECNKTIDELIESYILELPEGLTGKERKGFVARIRRQVGHAKLHVKVMYYVGRALGDNLSGLNQYSGEQGYQTFLNRIRMHLTDGSDQVNHARLVVESYGEQRECRLRDAADAPQKRRR